MSIQTRRIRQSAVALTLGAFSALCAGGAAADVPRVATDVAPVASLVARVMEGAGAPSQIVRQGASPHGYAMRPSEAGNLADAGAVFWIGPALTPWLEQSIETLAPGAAVVSLLEVPGTTVLPFRSGVEFEAHGEGDHDHGHDEEVDPHAWLDPGNSKVWMDAIAAELGRLDPENAALYKANAEAGGAEIDATAAEIRVILAPVAGLRFVVFHDAYQYFEAHFDMPSLGAIAAGDAAAPGPARIEAVQGVIRANKVACVFSEPEFNQSFVTTVIEGTDATASIIDPLGRDIAPGPAFYPDLLRAAARQLATCAG